jgi:membrane-bound metal-dependent hydrolase YbcI (DUF457 family)
MTFVGHSLTGVAIGTLCIPENTTTRWKGIYFAAFAALANFPDIPIRYWGHDRYDISHSIFVNLLLIGFVVAVIMFKRLHASLGGLHVMIGGSLAWLSHLLLDSFYNHGYGIAIYWPLSRARLTLPIPWFSVLPSTPPPLTMRHIEIYSIELLAYAPVVICALGLRFLWKHQQKQLRSQQSTSP